MSIPSIITPMNMSLVRDAICQLLANERDKQIELARKSGADEEWIENTLDFTIFPKRFRYPSAEDLPCVYVYFNEGTFPGEEQDIYSNNFLGNLQVEYYAGGVNEIDEDEENIDYSLIKTADTNAEDRLNYLTAQIYKILCSEETNVYKGTDGLVNSFSIAKWKRILTTKETSPAESVLGAMFSFNVGIEEATYYTNTTQIKEFYTKLHIRDEFTPPIIRQILEF